MKSTSNDIIKTSHYLIDCPMCPKKIRKGSKITQLHEDTSMTLRNPDVKYGSRWIHQSCTNGEISIFNRASKCICESYMNLM